MDNTTGTGFVHIAPGHGLEDYGLGSRKRPAHLFAGGRRRLFRPHRRSAGGAADAGATCSASPSWKSTARARPTRRCCTMLRERGQLVHQENYHHSYPHCWRSKTPVIFRAMDQWFIEIDHADPDGQAFRAAGALEEIDRVHWVPDWGKSRIEAAVKSVPTGASRASAPGACPSRLSTIAAGQADPRRRHRAHARPTWSSSTDPTSGSRNRRRNCGRWSSPPTGPGPKPSAKSSDTLDVWIDSGSSSRIGLMRRPELQHSRGESDQQPPGQATCIWKAATSIAAGSSPRCCSPWPATAPRRTGRCSPTASWSMPTARRSPRANRARAATKNRRPPRPTSSNTAPTWCGFGSPPRISATTSS